MIIFSTNTWEWDVTNKGLNFNESSEFFSDKQAKNFSFPFTETINEEVAYKLDLVNVDGIYNYRSKIYGILQIDGDFYDAYISINNIVGNKAQLAFYYGKEVLKVFDKNLRTLNFPVIVASPNLPSYAALRLNYAWPSVSHQFVKVLRDDLKTKTNYKQFDGFLNNYVYNSANDTWRFPVNTNEIIEGETVSVNRNVMCPMTYLLEILKVGFATEGLDIRGDFVNNELVQKIVYIPKNFLEKLAATQFSNYSFTNYTNQETINGTTINVYQNSHTPTNTGSFSLKMNVNMSNVMAQYFDLKVTQNGIELFSAFSQNTQVNINETLDINILDSNIYFDIVVTLKLVQQNNISDFNRFTYEYKEGSLNVFPTSYTLADFMPDMVFREFVNKIRSWFNLKFDYTDNAVYINFLEDYLADITFQDKSHLQQLDPKRTINKNNLFKLTYPNGEEVLATKSGQIYSTTDFVDAEIEKIEIDVLPLEVRENYNVVTAVYPEDAEELMFTLYDGKRYGDNIAINTFLNESLKLQDIYNLRWKNWLRFRSNSETLEDSFYMHFTETLNLKEGVFKYNRQKLMLTIKKKRVTNEYWKITVTSETL